MSATNLGDQYITFDYRHPAYGSDFNTLLREGITPGVYKGGLITYSGTEITIAPFVIYINTSTDKLVRVETRANTVITVTESTPVIALTYTWQDVSEDWLDFNQRASGSGALTNEVCLGECVFGGGVITSITYASKTWGKKFTNDVPIGTAPFVITSTTKVDNLNVDLLDGYHFTDIINYLYPVGSFYVQYPNAASNTDATAFPTAYRPATMFGGTWVSQFDTENVFFRTAGTDYQTRTTGLSADQMQGHSITVSSSTAAGSAAKTVAGGVNENYPASPMHIDTFSRIVSDGVNGTPRTGAITEPRNRLFKIWKRTA